MSFSTIPVLDISLAKSPETKPAFLANLRNALLDIGFLYIKNTGIEDGLIQDVISQGKAFFELPEEKKLEIQMKNKPSFLGSLSPRYLPIERRLIYPSVRLQQAGERDNSPKDRLA